MRRKDREITVSTQINEIISACHCCRLGFNDDGKVYIVPLSFGYEEIDGKRIFYFHGASDGRKNHLITKTQYAGFELDTNYKLNEADAPCGYSARFQSVIGSGKVDFVEDIDQKKHALQCIMCHSTGKENWDFNLAMLSNVSIFQLKVEEMSCKEHE